MAAGCAFKASRLRADEEAFTRPAVKDDFCGNAASEIDRPVTTREAEELLPFPDDEEFEGCDETDDDDVLSVFRWRAFRPSARSHDPVEACGAASTSVEATYTEFEGAESRSPGFDSVFAVDATVTGLGLGGVIARGRGADDVGFAAPLPDTPVSFAGFIAVVWAACRGLEAECAECPVEEEE